MVPIGVPAAFAASTLTAATGGSAIPSNTTGGAYTTLTGPIISSIDNNDMSTETTGTIVFTRPTGFEFDTGGTAPSVVVTCTSNCGTGATNNINNLTSGSSINGANVVVTATTITVTITDDVDNTGGNNAVNSLTWQNIRVRPTAVSPLASGNITMSSMTFSGVGTTNVGTLTEVSSVIITPATGGSAISAATVGGTYTALTGPVIAEDDTGQIPTGTIILNAPTGFIFDTSSNVTGTVTVANPAACGLLGSQPLRLNGSSSQTVAPTSTTITMTVTQQASDIFGSCQSTITYSGIKVRPTAALPLASGNITKTGTSNMLGVSASTNFGTLTEVAPPGATLTVNATVTNDNGGTATAATFTYKVDATNVLSGAATSGLSVGAHTVTVEGTTGYAVTIGGDCASDGTITLAAADNKACSVTLNDIGPKITVTKSVTNDNGGAKVIADFTLKVDATNVLSGVQNTFSAGAHTISEVADVGYAATIGGDCASDGSLSTVLGGVYNCTITNNDIAPKLTITKIVTNDNGGTTGSGGFTLQLDGNTVTNDVQFVTTIGAHVVSEIADAQYTGAIIVGDCDINGNITLALGDVKHCYITNDDKPAHLIIDKQVTNDNGGTKNDVDFTINISANNPASASIPGAAAGTDVQVDAGSYDITETADVGYAASYSADCTGSIAPGETKYCTITNDDIQPKFTLTKVVVNDNGGTKVVSDFPVYIDAGLVTSGVQYGLDAGTYTVSELGMPSTYAASISGDCDSSGNVTLVVGDVKSCTITNDDIGPKLTIIKQVVNDDGATRVITDFTLKVNTDQVLSGSQTTLNVGDYIVGEIEDIDYDGTFSGDCNVSNGNIHLELGEVKTCTITNNDRVKNSFQTGNGGAEGRDGQGTSASPGHQTTRFTTQAEYQASIATGGGNTAPAGFGGGTLPEGAFGGGPDVPFSDAEVEYICSMQKAQPATSTTSFTEWLGSYMANLMGRDAAQVIAALKDPSFCAPKAEAAVKTAEPVALRVNKKGIVVSTNPVWNACVTGKKVSLGLIRANQDTYQHRQGAVEKDIPMTCRDYHRGDVNVWNHPDFPNLEITLDGKGRLIGDLPLGYIAVRDGAASNVVQK